MKKGFKWKLIAGCSALASLFILGGCKLGESLADVKEKYNLTARVTYYANSLAVEETTEQKSLAKFENNQVIKDLYYSSGTTAVKIDENSVTNISIKKTGYDFLNWYYVQEDAEGNLMFADEEHEIPIISDQKVDFTKKLEAGDHWNICAHWAKQARVKIKFVCDDLATGEHVLVGYTTYENGLLIKQAEFDDDNEYKSLTDAPLDIKGYTFIEYYNADCSGFVNWPIIRGDSDVEICAKYIKGDWNIIKTSSDVRKMFRSQSSGEDISDQNTKYYLINDVDCTDLGELTPIQEFAGTLIGANTFSGEGQYAIKNLTIKIPRTSSAMNPGSKNAIFREIKSTATIKNIDIQNVSVAYETKASGAIELYFLFTKLNAGAIIDRVNISGTMSIKFAGTKTAANLTGNQTDGWNGWQYGDATDADDSLQGFNMQNITISVSGIN